MTERKIRVCFQCRSWPLWLWSSLSCGLSVTLRWPAEPYRFYLRSQVATVDLEIETFSAGGSKWPGQTSKCSPTFKTFHRLPAFGRIWKCLCPLKLTDVYLEYFLHVVHTYCITETWITVQGVFESPVTARSWWETYRILWNVWEVFGSFFQIHEVGSRWWGIKPHLLRLKIHFPSVPWVTGANRAAVHQRLQLCKRNRQPSGYKTDSFKYKALPLETFLIVFENMISFSISLQ